MGISTSRLCDRRAYRGRIDGEYRMRAPSVASRSRTHGWRTATGPMPVMISRSGRWPWRTTRCWPVSVLRSVCFARNSATSASTAWVSSARAPLRRISVRESVKAPGWASLTTLLSDTAYHSFIGEVEALNTTTIRRLSSGLPATAASPRLIELSAIPVSVHEQAMRLAIAEARGNPAFPFRAVILRAADRQVMATGVNRGAANPTFHDEIGPGTAQSSSHLTRRWSKPDSNSRSHPDGELRWRARCRYTGECEADAEGPKPTTGCI